VPCGHVITSAVSISQQQKNTRKNFNESSNCRLTLATVHATILLEQKLTEVSKVRIDRVELAAAMARADLNVKRLAEKSGVSRGTITSVKTGKSCSKDTAEKLAAVLGRDIIKEA